MSNAFAPTSEALLQFEGAGAADDRFGAVGLVAPYFDLGASAFAFRVALDDQAFWAGDVIAPHDVDEPQIHLAAVEEAESETLRHHFGDEADREHPLDDNLREPQFDGLLLVVVIVPCRSRKSHAHLFVDLAHRRIDWIAATFADLERA